MTIVASSPLCLHQTQIYALSGRLFALISLPKHTVVGIITHETQATSHSAKPKQIPLRLNKICTRANQGMLIEMSMKRTRAEKQKAYRERQKTHKQHLKETQKSKWEEIGGAKKVRVRIHQYDIRELRRIARLGTCPTARGSFVPTARIASYMKFLITSR